MKTDIEGNFITGDAHFRVLRDSVPHPAFERIILTEQLEQIWDLTMQKIKAQEAKDAQC